MSTLTIRSDQPEVLEKLRAFLQNFPGITFDSDIETEPPINEWLNQRPLDMADLYTSIEQVKKGETLPVNL